MEADKKRYDSGVSKFKVGDWVELNDRTYPAIVGNKFGTITRIGYDYLYITMYKTGEELTVDPRLAKVVEIR